MKTLALIEKLPDGSKIEINGVYHVSIPYGRAFQIFHSLDLKEALVNAIEAAKTAEKPTKNRTADHYPGMPDISMKPF